ncbi:hypothetical protein BDR22DRAFT_841096 [Usnea florida]
MKARGFVAERCVEYCRRSFLVPKMKSPLIPRPTNRTVEHLAAPSPHPPQQPWPTLTKTRRSSLLLTPQTQTSPTKPKTSASSPPSPQPQQPRTPPSPAAAKKISNTTAPSPKPAPSPPPAMPCTPPSPYLAFIIRRICLLGFTILLLALMISTMPPLQQKQQRR